MCVERPVRSEFPDYLFLMTIVQDIRILVEPDEVAHTLRDFRPLSFYGKNKTLYLITGLSDAVDWNIVSNIVVFYLPCTWSFY